MPPSAFDDRAVRGRISLPPAVVCAWAGSGDGASVLPDGCVDVVWSNGRLVVAGPATQVTEVAATPGQPRFGVRLRVGAVEAALGAPAWELRDLEVELEELWGARARRLAGDVERAVETAAAVEAATVARGLSALAAGVGAHAAGAEPDALVRAAAARLARPGARFSEVARALAIGERQLRRRFERSVGYSGRTFARVHRLQRLLALAELRPAGDLARLAFEAGYADQPHMARDVRRLSGRSPAALLATRPRAAGERTATLRAVGASADTAETFKTAAPAARMLRA